jgi:hypothetical protein|tara:strand:- start:3047 stop:3577 length:531 start_codon:yes stop_codon:yes gene_type:complete
MACENLSLGRLKPCKDSVGGLKAVYFINYGELGPITFDSSDTDVIDSIGTGVSCYKYDVHFSSSLTQNIQASMENGTVAFEQVVELSMPRLSKEDNKEIKLISYGHPHIVVEDQNGSFFLAGTVNGMEVTGGTIVTGTAMGDMSGYTLTLTGMERTPANFLASDLATAGGTVVLGV